MKNFHYLMLSVIITLSTVLTGCTTTSPEVVVGSDFKLGEPIAKFKTYNWVVGKDDIPKNRVFVAPGGVYIFNNPSTRNQINEAVEYELSARGFTKDTAKPDMLINYLIFEQEGELRTYNGYQIINGVDSVRTQDNVASVKVKPGTLYISITGGASNGVVWQGYASGILGTDTMKNPAKVKAAVQQIFNEFKYKAFSE